MSNKKPKRQPKKVRGETKSTIAINERINGIVDGIVASEGPAFWRTAGMLAAIPLAIVVVFYFVNINSGMVNTLLSVPGGVCLFFLVSVFMKKSDAAKGRESVRLRMSAARRRRVAVFVFLGLLALSFIAGSYPSLTILNGTVFVGVTFLLIDFIRMTKVELELDLEGLPDPRDIIPHDSYAGRDRTLPEDFSWEEELDDLITGDDLP